MNLAKMLHLQRLSGDLAQEFLNDQKNRGALKDLMLTSLLGNGFAYGAYMGYCWAEARVDMQIHWFKRFIRWLFSWFVSQEVQKHAEAAAQECIKKKWRALNPNDRETTRYALIQGFKRGAREFETQKLSGSPAAVPGPSNVTNLHSDVRQAGTSEGVHPDPVQGGDRGRDPEPPTSG